MATSPSRFFTHDRLDLVVKVRFFEALARRRPPRDHGEMYAKHILARTRGVEPGNPAKANVDGYVKAARDLLRNMTENGFDSRKPIRIDQWGRLRDGAHRIACATVLGLNVELSCVTAPYPIRQWGIDWFRSNGFTRDYVKGLLDHLNLITGYSNPAGGVPPPSSPDLQAPSSIRRTRSLPLVGRWKTG